MLIIKGLRFAAGDFCKSLVFNGLLLVAVNVASLRLADVVGFFADVVRIFQMPEGGGLERAATLDRLRIFGEGGLQRGEVVNPLAPLLAR